MRRANNWRQLRQRARRPTGSVELKLESGWGPPVSSRTDPAVATSRAGMARLPGGSERIGRQRRRWDVLRLDRRSYWSGCGDRVRMTVNDPPATVFTPENEGDAERDHGLSVTDQPPLMPL